MSGPFASQQVAAMRHLYRPPDPGNERAPLREQRGARKSAGEARFHIQHASAEPLLQRLEGVQKSGTGWRARCPACGGRSRKLSIAEADNRVLLHCFGGCSPAEVLGAVGLGWSDVQPPRSWPPTREEQRRASRAIREASWAAALSMLALESRVVVLAARDMHHLGGLQSSGDLARLAQAVERIGGAAGVLCSGAREVGA